MTTINHSARVGVITDQTGALSFMGIANVNVAKMVIDDLNDRGGLLGRRVELWEVEEHRIGLKPILHKVWCFDGHRPLAPVQHRY
jgi:Periplasmic binding protein